MAQAKLRASWRGARLRIVLGGLLCFVLSGCVAGADGGPHPEPPDGLGPPAGGLDGGVPTDNPVHESAGGQGGAGGALVAGSGGTGGAGGDWDNGAGGCGPTACMDASIDAGWDDEDSGALRSRSR